ncbi:hypothetical protein [Rhizobium leguminosarum]|uniref:hypothetical protein n=1 Tax=Rhizobium leguminosarum TaxID=384 RepID=UPI00144230F9|nr:hypothetical protein [Rhizobium leguminosarum]NKL74836.1 hypothetical protein [Rhizobium leguminosarum bv. viciae]
MGSEENSAVGEHPWALVGRRLSRPCKQWTFYAVLVVGILVLGYLAVWIEFKNALFFHATENEQLADLKPLRLAYATAIMAVALPCTMQLGLTLNKMAVVSGIILAFIVLLFSYWLSFDSESFRWTNVLGIIGLIVATLCWWLANGEDELFQDRVNPNSASGGDPSRPLSGGTGGVKV